MQKIDPLKPIYLRETRPSGFMEFIHHFMEFAVFFRWSFFKNRPRGNYLMFRSFIQVTIFATIYYNLFNSFEMVLEGIEIDGRFVVIFSPYDISCALERQSTSACEGYVQKDAFKIAHNLFGRFF